MSESMQIYDGGPAAKKARREAKSWNGFHLLLTAPARHSVMLSCLKIPMLLAAAAGAGVCLAQGVGVLYALVFGLVLALIVYVGFQDEVYKRLYCPDRDGGRLTLPEGMSWEEAVDRIRRGFANPDVEQVTDTPDAITFHSRKCGTYQLQNTQDGLKMTILAKPSQSSKKEYLYAVFSSMLLSQVIALLYPEKISAAQVEEEKAQVQKLFRRHKMPMLIELAIGAVVLIAMGVMLYKLVYSDTARSRGVSDSHLNLFTSEATVGEVLDDFFADGKWDNYKESGVTFVTYTGEGTDRQTKEKVVFVFYFKLGSDGSSEIDRITWNGDTMNTLEQYAVLTAINKSYCDAHGLASSDTLSDKLDELEKMLNEPWDAADSTAYSDTAEPESENAVSEPEESDSIDEADWTEDSADDDWNDDWDYDWDDDSLRLRLQEDSSYYWDESDSLDEDERSYLRSLGEQTFFEMWENVMIGDMDLMSTRYDDNMSAYEDMANYLRFYQDIFPEGRLANKYLDFYLLNGMPEDESQAADWVAEITGEIYYQ